MNQGTKLKGTMLISVLSGMTVVCLTVLLVMKGLENLQSTNCKKQQVFAKAVNSYSRKQDWRVNELKKMTGCHLINNLLSEKPVD